MASINSLATVNPNLIALELAQSLTPKLAGIAKFSVNYTNTIPEAIGYGGSFVVKNNGALPGTSLYVSGVGYAAQTASMTDTTITFNKARGSKLSFDSNEASSPVVQRYLNNFTSRAATALARDIEKDLFSVISNTNFTTSQSFASGSAAGRAALVQSNKVLDNAGVTDESRVVIVNSNYYAGLISDQTLFAPLYGGITNVTADGVLPHALGFDIAKADNSVFPSSYDGTNNLVGFAAHPSAIAFASIPPVDPNKLVSTTNVEYGYAVEPLTGLQIAIARWWDQNTENLYILPKALYGFSVGVPQALSAWVSPSAL